MVYALAAGMSDDGIQIVNVTNPAAPSAVAAVFDNTDGFVALNGVHDIEIIYVQDRVYALASGVAEDAVQIIDVTDPTSPSAAAAIRDGVGGFDALDGVRDAHAAAGPHMLVLASSGMDDGIQIINFTDPAAPSAVASVFDGEGGFVALDGVRDTATFRTDGRHYVLAAGAVDDAIQVADVTNPAAPSAVAAVFDGTGGFDSLNGVHDIEIIYAQDSVYALAASVVDDAIQVADVTNPAAPSAVATMRDGVNGFVALDGVRNMDVVRIDGMLYAVAVGSADDAVQIINVTNPAAPSAVAAVGGASADTPGGMPDQAASDQATLAAVDHSTDEKRYMLGLINAERRDAGLDPVALGNNPAAQIHADSMLEECFSGHWGVDGLLPYMRYTLAGGYQHNSENVSGLDYCVKAADNYRGVIIRSDLLDAMDGLMDSPGHRANILDPHHSRVNIGLAWDDYNVMLVQHFEYGYVAFEQLPSIQNGVISFSGTTLNGAALTDNLGIRLSYDPPPRDLTRGQLASSYCYDAGDTVALLVQPLPPGYKYTSYAYQETSQPCPDPYDVRPGVPAPMSVEQAHAAWNEAYTLASSLPYVTLTVPYYVADRWDTGGDAFAVSADIESLLGKYGPGVYTVWISGEAGGDQVTISSYSIFHGIGQPAGYR